MTLDGATIADSAFSGIAYSWEAYRGSLAGGTHVLTGSAPSELEGPVALWVSGEGGSAGFAYLGGLADPIYIDP